MQVLCKASNTSSDVRCTVCGQGFLVYFWNSSLQSRNEVKAQVHQALRNHHHTLDSHAAHPGQGFNVPEWSGEAMFAADSLTGAAPAWVAR